MLSRFRQVELMDNPNLDAELHAEALRGLERLNVLSSSANLLWKELKNLAQNKTTIRVLDIATGSGDIPINLAQRARNADLRFEFVGADISKTAIDLAQKKAHAKNVAVDFIQLDVSTEEIPSGFDVIMTSLFTHHLDPPQVIDLFSKMHKATKQLLLVNDLVRSPLSFAIVWLATRLVTRSPIVQYDGPVSVKASYTMKEMKQLAQKAGLNNCSIKYYPPCRQLLVYPS